MFHLGWFIGKGYSPHNWNQPWSGDIGSDWMEPDLYVDLARALERACFDCLILEDGSFIADAFQGSPEWYLRNAVSVPKSDPLPLVPLLGYVTKRLGIVATITTTFWPPYLAARLGATLDQLTHGRVGLNVVSAHQDRTAQNFGLDRHYEHDFRYEMADEWMQVVTKLWDSWAARHQRYRKLGEEVEDVRDAMAADTQYVAKSSRDQQGHAVAAALDDRVDGQCRAVDEVADVRRVDAVLIEQDAQAVEDRLFRPGGHRGCLEHGQRAGCFLQQGKIRESTADIDTKPIA
jgi:alkanesulfonate monooxygenase SsuD/methylene tetrahydromethanopterin reductase-like flavin-dependent oxidoreductase (luciferase family)